MVLPLICAPKGSCKQQSLSLKEILQDLVDLQHRRSQDSGKSVFPGQPVNWKRSSLGRAQTVPDSVSPTCISVVSSSKGDQGRSCLCHVATFLEQEMVLGLFTQNLIKRSV